MYAQARYGAARSVRLAELASVTEAFGASHAYVAISLAGLGRRSLAAGDVLLAAYDGLVAHRGPESAATLAVRQHLVELYEAWGRPAQAARFRSRP